MVHRRGSSAHLRFSGLQPTVSIETRRITRAVFLPQLAVPTYVTYYAPPLGPGALSDDARLTSDACLSVVYIGLKSRTEMPRKTKIGTEVAHVTRDYFQGQKVKSQFAGGGGILWRPPAQLVYIGHSSFIDPTRTKN